MLVQSMLVQLPSTHTCRLSEFVECGKKTGQITQLLHDLRIHRSVREITPRISGALAASLRRVSMRFQFWSQICPPTQITLAVDKKIGGAFGYLIGGLAMGPAYPPHSTQERLMDRHLGVTNIPPTSTRATLCRCLKRMRAFEGL